MVSPFGLHQKWRPTKNRRTKSGSAVNEVRGEFLFGLVTRTSLGISASQATVVFSFPGWHPDPPTRPQEFLMLPLLYYKSATMKSLACVIKAKRAFRPSSFGQTTARFALKKKMKKNLPSQRRLLD
jgi:hypothetical protein